MEYSVSTLKANSIQPTTGTGVSIPGHILQIQDATLATQTSATIRETYYDFGLKKSFTTLAANSKFFISAVVHVSAVTNANAADWGSHFVVYRNTGGSAVAAGTLGADTSNNRPRLHTSGEKYYYGDYGAVDKTVETFDSPSLAAGTTLEYQIRLYHGRTTGTWFINRGYNMSNDATSGGNPCCTLKIMEIAQ